MKVTPAEIVTLEELLGAYAPAVEVTLKPPFHESGKWWVELRRGAEFEAISWQRTRGFEIYPIEEPSFGLKADQSSRSAEAAYDALARTLASWKAFRPLERRAHA